MKINTKQSFDVLLLFIYYSFFNLLFMGIVLNFD